MEKKDFLAICIADTIEYRSENWNYFNDNKSFDCYISKFIKEAPEYFGPSAEELAEIWKKFHNDRKLLVTEIDKCTRNNFHLGFEWFGTVGELLVGKHEKCNDLRVQFLIEQHKLAPGSWNREAAPVPDSKLDEFLNFLDKIKREILPNNSGFYIIRRIDNTYRIFNGDEEVKTPDGNPFDTKSQDLAQLVCDDINHYGPDPVWTTPSYVSLHAGYCDFIRKTGRSGIIYSAELCYQPKFDIALAKIKSYKYRSSFTSTELTEKSNSEDNPISYFGAPPRKRKILQWLETLSDRALISVDAICTNYVSVLCGYRLLTGVEDRSIDQIVQGLFRYKDQFSFDHYCRLKLSSENEVKEFFIKAKNYASFPDD